MSMGYKGTYYNSIDGKNRMIVPVKLRKQLGEGCVITIGIEGCLRIYSQEGWEEYEEKLDAIPENDLEAQKIIRKIFANATDCEFDKQGKVNIPENLKKHAHITKDLVTMGVKRFIEVWAKEVWEAPDNDLDMTVEEMAAVLRQYNI
jgi:MraZ protein